MSIVPCTYKADPKARWYSLSRRPKSKGIAQAESNRAILDKGSVAQKWNTIKVGSDCATLDGELFGSIVRHDDLFLSMIPIVHCQDSYSWVLRRLPPEEDLRSIESINEFAELANQHPSLFARHQWWHLSGDIDGKFFSSSINKHDLVFYLYDGVSSDLIRYILFQAFQLVQVLNGSKFAIPTKHLIDALQVWEVEKGKYDLRLGTSIERP